MCTLIKSLFRLTVVTFIFAMLIPVATTRADPNCDRHPDNPKCSGDTSIVYTAELSLGGFVFDPGPSVDLLPDSKGTKLLSQTDLTMLRPVDLVDPVGAYAWDTVFAACQLLIGQIDGFMVSNEKWSITNFDQPRVAFGGVLLQGAKVTVQLIGDGISSDPFLPTLESAPSVFNLSKFAITGRSLRGGSGPSKSCSPRGQQINTLLAHSTLTITASTP